MDSNIRLALFFLYADIFLSQFEPLFGLPRDKIFVECSKNLQHLFYCVLQ